jgi:hypothetical protein
MAEASSVNYLSYLGWLIAVVAAGFAGAAKLWWSKEYRATIKASLDAKDESLKAKDEALKAKDGELKAHEARMQTVQEQLKFYKDLSPKALLEHVTAQASLFTEYKNKLDVKLDEESQRLQTVSQTLEQQKARSDIAEEKIKQLEREKMTLEQEMKSTLTQKQTTDHLFALISPYLSRPVGAELAVRHIAVGSSDADKKVGSVRKEVLEDWLNEPFKNSEKK